MTNDTQEPRTHGFAIGLVTGACAGAGLIMWLAPNAACELRRRLTSSVARLGDRATAQYQEGRDRVGVTVDRLSRQGEALRDEVAESVAIGAHEVARGANEVERVARASMSARS